ncbi:MAG TPA: cytochrome b N-terminal domain-containing protein [Solirubrobacterales bacterium]|nr:cytochrome b N-terminal domain-containing protein [Solirubrobacterales bacterium]
MPKLQLPAALRRPAKPGSNGQVDGKAPEDLRETPAARPEPKVTDQAVEAGKDVVGWVDQRTGLSGFLTGMLYRKVPKGTNWFYTLGSATLFAFVVQAITGVFLAMYYTPSPTQAYGSVTHLTNDVFLGEFVRGMHKWGASVMIILLFLHMGRTFFFGAYKYPRELNWVIGVVLLILTFVMGLTGYLLPFDQRSFWATVVANNITATGPVVGPYLADFLRAGAEFGPTTLTRFYAIHMLLVPGAIIALIGAHLYLVVKLGTTAPPWLKAQRPGSTRPVEAVVAGANGASPNGDRSRT